MLSSFLVPPLPPFLAWPLNDMQAIGTVQVVEAVAEAACAKPLEMQLAMHEVRDVWYGTAGLWDSKKSIPGV